MFSFIFVFREIGLMIDPSYLSLYLIRHQIDTGAYIKDLGSSESELWECWFLKIGRKSKGLRQDNIKASYSSDLIIRPAPNLRAIWISRKALRQQPQVVTSLAQEESQSPQTLPFHMFN